MLNAFYGAFSPACFALLGLWLVVVQIRLPEWQRSSTHRRMSYGVALHFALPGLMSVLALVNPLNPAFWRVSFAIIALGGAVVLVAVRGIPGRHPGRDAGPGQAGAPGAAGPPGDTGRTVVSAAARQLDLALYLTSVALYLLIGLLAFAGGLAVLRVEAILLTALLFVGFQVAWMMMFENRQPYPAEPSAADH